jgi:hypothetical protein
MSENNCLNVQRMSQATLLGFLGDSQEGKFLQKIPLSSWEVISFNPRKYEVCIRIYPNFNQQEIEDSIASLRVQLSLATDLETRLSLENAIRAQQTKLANRPQITATYSLSSYTDTHF